MDDRPPVFASLSFSRAMDLARANQRLLLVDFTASWCMPCREMDRTTWRSAELVRWIAENAVAVQIDVDDAGREDGLDIQSVPTLVAFRDGRELDRSSGSRSAKQLVEWLADLDSGRTELDRLRQLPETDLHGRLRLASELVRRGLDDEALEVFAWLWEHALEVDEAFYGVRLSFLIAALEPLVDRSAAARARFSASRERLVDQLAQPDAFTDWVALNELLGDGQRILDWLAAASPDDARHVRLDRNRRVRDLLESSGSWDLLGELIDDPLALLREDRERIDQLLNDVPGFVTEDMLRDARATLFRTFRASVTGDGRDRSVGARGAHPGGSAAARPVSGDARRNRRGALIMARRQAFGAVRVRWRRSPSPVLVTSRMHEKRTRQTAGRGLPGPSFLNRHLGDSARWG